MHIPGSHCMCREEVEVCVGNNDNAAEIFAT